MRANRSGWSWVVWRGVAAAGSSSPYHMMCVSFYCGLLRFAMRLQGVSVDKRRYSSSGKRCYVVLLSFSDAYGGSVVIIACREQ